MTPMATRAAARRSDIRARTIMSEQSAETRMVRDRHGMLVTAAADARELAASQAG